MSELQKQFLSLWRTIKAYPRYRVQAEDKWKNLRAPAIEKSLAHTEKWIKGIASKPSLTPLDLEKLRDKIQSVYTGRAKVDFTRRERRNFPFILLSEKNSVALTRFIMRYIDLGKTLTFRRVLFVYFNKFTKDDPKIVFLQNVLQEWVTKKDLRAMERNAFLKKSPFLLSMDGTKKLGKLFLQSGIVGALQDIDFPSNLFASQFVKMAIQEAFHLQAPMKTKLERFVEVVKNPLYKGQTPYIIGPLIIGAAKAGNAAIIAQLMDLIFKVMGDPRGNNASWIHVEEEAQKIYYQWMVKNDFAVFFSLIERTAGSTSENGDVMWKYRQAFWKAYMDEISMSRIILGDEARREAQRLDKKLTNYDILEGKSADSSLLVFVIGDYTFIEPSHNGKLRIYKNKASPIDIMAIGHNHIDYRDITRTYTYEEFVHTRRGDIPSWQPKVRSWLKTHCGIWRDERQWRL